MANEAAHVLQILKDNNCDHLDIKFTDVPGTWQHLGLPINEVNDDLIDGVPALCSGNHAAGRAGV